MAYAPITVADAACLCGHVESWHRRAPDERVCTLDCGCPGYRPADAPWDGAPHPHALPWS